MKVNAYICNFCGQDVIYIFLYWFPAAKIHKSRYSTAVLLTTIGDLNGNSLK